ncbi:ATP-dependent RNA helicase DDX51-like [Gigantopelta aegis]|uniref:ATP-dependent RNA helicase DDX51-like n=1 Tax=Gigantopelta aegis TaxID=1735272 RepID=UPI001B887614|nr:ATP-dependent RNA helicase DDX51-like [Gigantopelta aegis]
MMALFSIQRFMGDEEEEEVEEKNSTKASHILKKLRDEALARKQKRLGDQQLSTDVEKDEKTLEISSPSPSPKRQKHIKKKEKHLIKSTKDAVSQQLVQNDKDMFTDESAGYKSKKRKISETFKGSEEYVSDVSNAERHTTCSVDISKKNYRKRGQKHTQQHVRQSVGMDDDSTELINNEKSTEDSLTEITDDQEQTVDDSLANLADDEDDDDMEEENDFKQDGPHEVGGFTVLGDYKKKQVEKVKRILPDWLAQPSVIGADLKTGQVPVSAVTELHPVLLENLTKNGITHFFPVQSQVIPVLLDTIRHGIRVGRGGYQPSDICVSASTGSGKTLAFVLPIIQALKDCVVRKIRAVAVLPVRDLASQVYRVFQTYCEGTNIKVGLLVGQKTFEVEQGLLVKKRQLGYQSLVDIIVTTPGRLVDHINKTEGMDLTHLRFLVIDEADRMIGDIKQDWLQTLENAVFQSNCTAWGRCSRERPGTITVASSQKNQIPLQKLLFSATLSQNPEKLQQLNLFQPKLFTSVVKATKQDQESAENVISDTSKDTKGTEISGDFVGKYTTPAGLTEFFIESSKAEKPLVILHFLHSLKFRQVLCFTNSVETTHRLYLLIKLVGGINVREFSSGLHAIRRNKILRKFSAGQVDILICSDAMARGMDIDNIKYVISYDGPPFIKTYIHRVGRTARAGKTGTSFTLLEQKEIFHFKKMLKEAGKIGVKEMKLARRVLKSHIPVYQEALQQLPEVIKIEKTKTKR